jgi:p-aminobenzoyl-glutamate transporter AbgT
VLGRNNFRWHALLAAAIVLAPLSAVILQNQGFGALAGISTIIACLAINQLA